MYSYCFFGLILGYFIWQSHLDRHLSCDMSLLNVATFTSGIVENQLLTKRFTIINILASLSYSIPSPFIILSRTKRNAYTAMYWEHYFLFLTIGTIMSADLRFLLSA